MKIVEGNADMQVTDDPEATLITHCLGPCIGVATNNVLIRSRTSAAMSTARSPSNCPPGRTVSKLLKMG